MRAQLGLDVRKMASAPESRRERSWGAGSAPGNGGGVAPSQSGLGGPGTPPPNPVAWPRPQQRTSPPGANPGLKRRSTPPSPSSKPPLPRRRSSEQMRSPPSRRWSDPQVKPQPLCEDAAGYSGCVWLNALYRAMPPPPGRWSDPQVGPYLSEAAQIGSNSSLQQFEWFSQHSTPERGKSHTQQSLCSGTRLRSRWLRMTTPKSSSNEDDETCVVAPLQATGGDWAATMASKLLPPQESSSLRGTPEGGPSEGAAGTSQMGGFDASGRPQGPVYGSSDGPATLSSPFMHVLEPRASDARGGDPKPDPNPGSTSAAAAGAAAGADQRCIALDWGDPNLNPLPLGSSGCISSTSEEGPGRTWHEEGGWLRAGDQVPHSGQAPPGGQARGGDPSSSGQAERGNSGLAAYRCMIVMEFCEAGARRSGLQK